MAYGFGIIGCGMIANFHAKAIADVRGAKLVACCDMFPASADRFAAANDCRGYHDLKSMLADDEIDVVTICTPSGAHLDPAVAAARACLGASGSGAASKKPARALLRQVDSGRPVQFR